MLWPGCVLAVMFCGFNLADRLVWLFPSRDCWSGSGSGRIGMTSARSVGEPASVKKCFSSAFLRLTARTCWPKRERDLRKGARDLAKRWRQWRRVLRALGQKIYLAWQYVMPTIVSTDGMPECRTAVKYDEYVRVCFAHPSGCLVNLN